MRRALALSYAVAHLILVGCAPVPPGPPIARESVSVRAPFAATWDAVIETFADRNIPIRTLDRASGLIVAEPVVVSPPRADSLADCGSTMGMPIPPDRAMYNVLVRGDSLTSTVKVTVRFTQGGRPNDPVLIECSSRGVWESARERAIKEAAERKVAH